MKILITSGGTKVKIDLVRSITNMSRGTFGSQICDSFWRKLITSSDSADKNEIVFFYAKNSRMPTAESNHNYYYDTSIQAIRYIEYDTFDDYRLKLTNLLKAEKFDIIVLAAAVSDYGVANYFNGKYHSSDDMTIKLVKLPKVITEVRALAPNATICGFKLLVNSLLMKSFVQLWTSSLLRMTSSFVLAMICVTSKQMTIVSQSSSMRSLSLKTRLKSS